MGYYMAGDYYAAGGIFGSIGKLVKGAVGIGSKIIPGPVGAGLGVISQAFGGGRATPTQPSQPLMLPGGPRMIPARAPSIPERIQAAGQALMPGGVEHFPGAFPYRKRRRMNVGNAKALRRAIRRQQGFVKLARRALKGTGYTVTSRGSSRRRPVSVRESGPGSVVVR